ncbi:MAG: hypothetical protein U9Q81_01740 [Pseudomonadota bacterium]|nr:hypothetical protein [Pseudomonadota bacterium]
MNRDYPGLRNPEDADLRDPSGEAIQRINEKYPSPDTPYRRDSSVDESWGQMLYTVSTI